MIFADSFQELLFPDEQFTQIKTEINKILHITDRPVNTIPDLCCGPGRFRYPLA